jgi:hypothetical protein
LHTADLFIVNSAIIEIWEHSQYFFFNPVDLPLSRGNRRACCHAWQMYYDYIPADLVERACTGPLARYIEPYIALMKQAGYVPAYVRGNLTVLGAFGRRLERWGLGVEDLNEDIVDRFVREMA